MEVPQLRNKPKSRGGRKKVKPHASNPELEQEPKVIDKDSNPE
jgi:hypothetical protein